jgi:hypothetical protein
MDQAGGLLRAGMQEAIDGNRGGLARIGETVCAAFVQAFVTARDEMVHAEVL